MSCLPETHPIHPHLPLDWSEYSELLFCLVGLPNNDNNNNIIIIITIHTMEHQLSSSSFPDDLSSLLAILLSKPLFYLNPLMNLRVSFTGTSSYFVQFLIHCVILLIRDKDITHKIESF